MNVTIIPTQTRVLCRQWARVVEESVKTCSQQGCGVYSVQKSATDSIGSTTLTLTNVVVGSAIRIEVQTTGALVESRTATLTAEVFALSYYESGAAANDLRIKVRKGSGSPLYKPFETLATIGAAAQSSYIAQIPD
jgi:hypothetical protein